jgi:transcriptional regulator with XRE-family HTH domain
MVSKELVGTRIRQARVGQRKTLKDVEATSGFSSTHISEIERGRTSPTIGALIRIAHALDKDPSYFIEERQLEEVCVTTPEERPAEIIGLGFSGSDYRVLSLTRGILGGRLLAYDLTLQAKGAVSFHHLPESGDLGLVCLAGSCRLIMGGDAVPFGVGDSLHMVVDEGSLVLEGDGEAPAQILIVMDPKEAIAQGTPP